MEMFTKSELEEALCALASMIARSVKAQAKFAEGTAQQKPKQGTGQHTMLENNLKALRIASPLLGKVQNRG